ncbi:MAG: EamA family transporter [Opitutales bacterium]
MTFQPYLLIPLACAFVYVLGALTVKRAGAFGVGVWRTNFVANWMMFLVFLPWWFGRGAAVHPLADYWQPAVTGLCFLGGQAFIFLALSRGDVSVTTPVMGSKVILVALFSSLLRVGEVPLPWWIGAGLSTAAVGLLHAGEKHGRHHHVRVTVLLATLSAASFGLGDVLMQKWVPAWGAGGFFPPMFLLVGLYSFAFVPFFSAPLRALSGEAWRWVGGGGLLMALNNAGIVLTLGRWGGATAVNIVYSARGLVSVVLVWAIGHWFASEEQHLAPRVLGFRLVGAALMLGAIALVLV